MTKPTDPPDQEDLRRKILGLGPTSMRKSYYPELQKRLQELESSERRFRRIVEASPFGMLFFRQDVHRQWFCEDANGAAETIVCCSADRLRAVPLAQLPVDPALREALQAIVAQTGEPVATTEKSIDCQLGNTTKHLELAGFPIDPGHCGVYLYDSTNRLNMEEQLRNAQRLEVVGRLAGGIAHDFNNLLTPILGYLQMVIEDTPAEDGRLEYLQEIKKAAESARMISKSLLAISRRQILELTEIELVQTVRDFGKILRRTIRENVAICYELEEPPLTIRADLTQMHQILLNLALNAQDAMLDGGTLTIRVFQQKAAHDCLLRGTYTQESGCVVLQISDTGFGIPPDVLPRIFEPFYSTKGKRGSGLGLATVYGIVQQFGGQIRVRSSPGKGTEFMIAFPGLNTKTECVQESTRSTTNRVERRSVYGQTVFLVEDDQQVRELVTVVLRDAGYQIHAFPSAEDCLSWVPPETMKPAVLVSDVILPGRSGCDLYEDLKRR
ncbi:MAG TPA: ATP-binding protein, partial [Candidatus Ozemobacteraceae bacterium]|nr:ATP-binding protein [Candidatus Ozemobacteraceae bacterium]